jgi:hypothetical protein
LGRLCQGIGSGATKSAQRVAGTNTFFIIDYQAIPAHKRKEICHTMVVCEVRPEKDDPDRTRITIGGNRICYPGDVGTNTASLELVKLLLNSVLSRKDARFSTIDLKNFYLDILCQSRNMFASRSPTSRPNSSLNTNLKAETEMDGSTLKYAKDVTDCPKQAFLQIIFSAHALCPKVSTKQSPLLDYGAINGVLSNSASSWMTSVSSTLALNISTSSLIF